MTISFIKLKIVRQKNKKIKTITATEAIICVIIQYKGEIFFDHGTGQH